MNSINDTPLGLAVRLAGSGETVNTRLNSAGVEWNIPTDIADVTAHVWAFSVAGNELIRVEAYGDGAGGITSAAAYINAFFSVSAGMDVTGAVSFFDQVIFFDNVFLNQDLTVNTIEVTKKIHINYSTVTSAGDLTLGVTNYNVVQGTTTINRILRTGFFAGDEITLEIPDGLTLKDNQGPSGEYMPFKLGADKVIPAGSIVRLVLNINQSDWVPLYTF